MSMASKYSMDVLLLVIFVPLFSSASLWIPISPSEFCNLTVYPKFCRSMLPYNLSWDLYDYSHFSLHQSISTTYNLSSSFSKILQQQWRSPSSMTRALEDCKELAELNVNFLSRAMNTLNSRNSSIDSLIADDMHALLSAILTNHETCLDGLQMSSSAWKATTDLQTPLSYSIKMYSLSLAIFKQTWGSVKREGQRTLPYNDTRNILREYLESVTVSNSVVVNPDGSGDFTTISEAINSAPNNTDISNGHFVIYVLAGVYEEYVNITKQKKNLLMIGDGINQTVITGNRSVGDGWSTFNSATFIVSGDGFVGVDMSIRNTAGAFKGQAVALRSGADMSAFYRCSFEGYQDTLYTHSLRQFYKQCDIYGTVDFIFGNAAVVLQDCNIYPTLPIHGQANEITAQGRSDPNQNTGTSFQNCNIRASEDLASSNSTTETYLGRPWKEYSRTVYMQSFMDSLIAPPGWDSMSGNFALSTLYYAEYNNSGPGSETTNRVAWPGYHVINSIEATDFTVSNFIAGDAWLPLTGVPYNAGLI